MKILATAIATADTDVGQLIFDPSGEYAYTNEQDEYALGELDDGHTSLTTVYKFKPDEEEEGVRPIRSNLLNRGNLEIVQSYVQSALADDDAIYTEQFLNTEIPSKQEIDDLTGGKETKAKRVHSAFFAVIAKALGEDKLPESFETVWLEINKDALSTINDAADITHEKKGGVVPLGQFNDDNQLVDFWKAAAKQREKLDDWLDDDLKNMFEMLDTSGNRGGYNKLSELKHFHNSESNGDIAQEVYEKLTEGNLIVIDISNGREDVVTQETKRVVNYVRRRSRERFRSVEEKDEELPDIQLYLEEAHQHFDKETYRSEGKMNPYVELAKEGAKFNVGLTYATQEVSSIDPRVRANTANWIITHLNSDTEINELADYYNFEDFATSIKDVEETGFVRMKTLSGEYIVPLSVSLFNEQWITENTDFSAQKRDTEVEDEDIAGEN